ncbi:aminotransferase class V-fold PLP-dependent enzyme [Bdellovibrionota bacterium FG-1]
MTSFRADFDLDPHLIYLNSGTQSICPRSVIQAQISYIQSYEKNPTAGLIGAFAALWQIQSRLAKFVGADPQDLFLRPNVTTTMNDWILGVPLEAGAEILISDTEYGAIANICYLRAQRDDLSVRSFHLPGRAEEMQNLTEEQLCDQIVQAIGPKTRLLVLSHVMTGHGLTLPLQKLASQTRARGVLLAIDGAHGVGAVPLNLKQLEDLDFYGGNLHKWTLGTKGTAFGWVHPRHQESLVVLQAGWTSFEAKFPYDCFAPGHRFAQRMLHSACIDFAPYMALSATFDYWEQKGLLNIRQRIAELQSEVENQMSRQLNWPLVSPSSGVLRGPLLSYDLPPTLEAQGAALMHTLYREHGLQVSSPFLQNRWILRFSPHIYNTEAEISQAVEILTHLTF